MRTSFQKEGLPDFQAPQRSFRVPSFTRWVPVLCLLGPLEDKSKKTEFEVKTLREKIFSCDWWNLKKINAKNYHIENIFEDKIRNYPYNFGSVSAECRLIVWYPGKIQISKYKDPFVSRTVLKNFLTMIMNIFASKNQTTWLKVVKVAQNMEKLA